MVRLGIPPVSHSHGRNLGRDLLATGPPLLLDPLGHVAGDARLVVVMVVDAAAVLGADVGALAVRGGGVVHLVEELEQLAVGDLCGVECYLQCFRICSDINNNSSKEWKMKK